MKRMGGGRSSFSRVAAKKFILSCFGKKERGKNFLNLPKGRGEKSNTLGTTTYAGKRNGERENN